MPHTEMNAQGAFLASGADESVPMGAGTGDGLGLFAAPTNLPLSRTVLPPPREGVCPWGDYAEGVLAGMSPGTRRAYSGAWVRYRSWCAERGEDWRQEVSLYGWTGSRAREGVAAGTLNKDFHAVSKVAHLGGLEWDHRRMCEYKRGVMKTCPTGSGSRALTTDEVCAMVDGIPEGDAFRVGMLLGYSGGLRIGEIVGLRTADAAWGMKGSPDCVRLRLLNTKGDRSRRGATVWVWSFGLFDVPGEVCLLAATRGDGDTLVGMSSRTFRRRFAAACDAAGVDQAGLSVHGLRAGCATAAVNGGVPLPVLQRHLRHANASTTARYYRDKEGRDTGAAIGRAL